MQRALSLIAAALLTTATSVAIVGAGTAGAQSIDGNVLITIEIRGAGSEALMNELDLEVWMEDGGLEDVAPDDCSIVSETASGPLTRQRVVTCTLANADYVLGASGEPAGFRRFVSCDPRQPIGSEVFTDPAAFFTIGELSEYDCTLTYFADVLAIDKIITGATNGASAGDFTFDVLRGETDTVVATVSDPADALCELEAFDRCALVNMIPANGEFVDGIVERPTTGFELVGIRCESDFMFESGVPLPELVNDFTGGSFLDPGSDVYCLVENRAASAPTSTVAPTTAAPTTAAPTTAAPTTAAPGTVAPTTAAPTTVAPAAPTTTVGPQLSPVLPATGQSASTLWVLAVAGALLVLVGRTLRRTAGR